MDARDGLYCIVRHADAGVSGQCVATSANCGPVEVLTRGHGERNRVCQDVSYERWRTVSHCFFRGPLDSALLISRMAGLVAILEGSGRVASSRGEAARCGYVLRHLGAAPSYWPTGPLAIHGRCGGQMRSQNEDTDTPTASALARLSHLPGK
jgi:hypothetical protein